MRSMISNCSLPGAKTFMEAGVHNGYRYGVKKHFSSRDVKPEHVGKQDAMPDMARVKILEEELLQYHYMIEEMVRQRTAQLSRRVALLRACNSKLCDEFGKMRDKYLDLLGRTNRRNSAEIVNYSDPQFSDRKLK